MTDRGATEVSTATDSEVLRLRRAGRAFARISRELDLARPLDAQQAFQRAVGRLPVADQARIRKEEGCRLDRLAAAVTADTTRPVEDRSRRLAAVEKLRGLLPLPPGAA